MYCKNCGRQLKERTRFCDRCGQSVRKSNQTVGSARKKEIEELKAERLNRKKRLAEKEAKQAYMKKRKKKRGGAVKFVFAALLIAVISVMVGYKLMSSGQRPNTLAATSQPSMNNQTTPSQAPSSGVKNGYTSITISGITCPYPSSFRSDPVTGNQKLNLTDALGGAVMTVTQEGKSGSASDLMREYARETGGEISYSRAGNDWYALTTEAQGSVYHRKCILKNGIAVYYDFTYSSSASTAQKYQEYIEYIDSNFK